MTRTAFLSFLGLGAAGQATAPMTLKISPAGTLESEYPLQRVWVQNTPGDAKPPKPANGECPCCGTQAPSYKPKTYTIGGNCKKPEDAWHWHTVGCHKQTIVTEDKTRQVECAHCRVVFAQDAEGEK
jgi:hypothetical protein